MATVIQDGEKYMKLSKLLCKLLGIQERNVIIICFTSTLRIATKPTQIDQILILLIINE